MSAQQRSQRTARAVQEKLRENFAQFAGTQAAGAVVLLGATIVALALANSSAHAWYAGLWETQVGFVFGGQTFTASLREIINDGLMTLFFLVVGLEIKRELLVGELSARRKAVLPIVAALGGMVVPAAIYIAFNHGGPGAAGWGIPMATDIVFAVGVMSLLGKAVPQALKVFLVSLAIVDDIGAIVVIAFAYSGGIAWVWLALAAVAFGVLVLLNRLSIDNTAPYVVTGIVLWVFVLLSGVHSTIAGVLLAFVVPSTARLDPLAFCDQTRETLGVIEDEHVPGAHVLENDRQQLAARRIRSAAKCTAAPLQRLEFALHPWATFVVLPLFALANAGVRVVDMRVGTLLGAPVALGIILGLVLGKPIGIFAASWLAERFHLAELPANTRWRDLAGAGLLGGVGFTMSIFIGGLAFGHSLLAEEAKASIIIASIVAGAIGYAVLRSVGRRREPVSRSARRADRGTRREAG
ncbi:MAG: Na+/H+ antiporter NhaA [Coriobacteriia bacterium]